MRARPQSRGITARLADRASAAYRATARRAPQRVKPVLRRPKGAYVAQASACVGAALKLASVRDKKGTLPMRALHATAALGCALALAACARIHVERGRTVPAQPATVLTVPGATVITPPSARPPAVVVNPSY